MSAEEIISLKSDLELSAEIREGNASAFDKLFRKYYSPLCDFVFLIVKSRDATEDIVQEFLANLWIHRADWIPDISVKAYLYKAVRNMAIDYTRHLHVVDTWLEKQIEISSGDVIEEVTNRDLLATLQEAIEHLPRGERTIFLMSREEGFTYTEIAAVLGISVKTVETQMGRALKNLRRYIRVNRG